MTAREAVFKALGAFRREGALPDNGFGLPVDGTGADARETALAMRIFNGVLQNMAYCDFVISFYSSIELKKLHPSILDILRLSVYQIIFLDRVPNNAAVNEGVLMAKKHSNGRAAGFVNAVLRKVADEASLDNLPEVIRGDKCIYLAIKYSHPEWLVREFCARLGFDGAEKLLLVNNSQNTPITAQVNTLRAETGLVLSSLAADGVDVSEHRWLSDCILMRRFGAVERLESFISGHIYIQDAASRLAVIAADPKPGDNVIDGCAAPGGKSIAAAIMMKDLGSILACDISIPRLERIKESVSRLKINSISASARDALDLDPSLIDTADVLFADVPCSGFGIIRRKPDVRYKEQKSIASLPDTQRKILFNLSAYVKPGGTLLYSTCTLSECENEEVVDVFLNENRSFSLARFDLPGIGEVPSGKITLWPHIHETDGFFICKMIRKSI